MCVCNDFSVELSVDSGSCQCSQIETAALLRCFKCHDVYFEVTEGTFRYPTSVTYRTSIGSVEVSVRLYIRTLAIS